MKKKIFVSILFVSVAVTSFMSSFNRVDFKYDLLSENVEALSQEESEPPLLKCVKTIKFDKDKESYNARYCTGCKNTPVTGTSDAGECHDVH